MPPARLPALVLLACCACAPTGPRQRVDRVRAAGAVFGLRYLPEDAEAARQIERTLQGAVHAAERWGELSAPVLITIHPTHRALEAAAHRQDAWFRAWARHASIDLQSPRTWTAGAASDAQVAEILSHELAHCAMFQMVKGGGLAGRAIPMWFREGMASVAAAQASRRVSPEAARRPRASESPGGLRTGTRGGGPPSEGALDRHGSAPGTDPDLLYAAAARAFRAFLDRFGDAAVRRIMTGMGHGSGFGEAFLRATGISAQEFEGGLGSGTLRTVRVARR